MLESDLIVKCDKCGKEYDDIMEIQEMVKFRFTGGYGSIFGDGTRVIANICQYCLKPFLDGCGLREDEW